MGLRRGTRYEKVPCTVFGFCSYYAAGMIIDFTNKSLDNFLYQNWTPFTDAHAYPRLQI